MQIIKIKIILEDGRKMNVDLFPEYAPISVENFVNLIKNKYFDGLIFHRIIKDFMIQGGGMTPDMKEKEGLKPIKGEFAINGWNKNAKALKHELGVLSMARTNEMNSATSQFFIVTGDASFLDGQYASFGKIADQESLNIALEIQEVATTTSGYYEDVPVEPIVIKTLEFI